MNYILFARVRFRLRLRGLRRGSQEIIDLFQSEKGEYARLSPVRVKLTFRLRSFRTRPCNESVQGTPRKNTGARYKFRIFHNYSNKVKSTRPLRHPGLGKPPTYAGSPLYFNRDRAQRHGSFERRLSSLSRRGRKPPESHLEAKVKRSNRFVFRQRDIFILQSTPDQTQPFDIHIDVISRKGIAAVELQSKVEIVTQAEAAA